MTQPLFSHINTDLTITYRPKCLYENYWSQLRSWSALGKNSSTETGKKSNFTSPASTSPPNQLNSVPGENALICDYSLREKLRVEHASNVLAFLLRTSKRTGFCFTSLGGLTKPIYFACLVSLKTKKSGGWLVAANTAQHSWEKVAQPKNSPTGGRKRSGTWVWHSSSWEDFLRNWIWLRDWQGVDVLLMPSGHWE